LSVCLSASLSVCLFVCMYVSLYVSLFVCMFVCLSVYLSVCLSVYLSVSLSVCLCVCLSFYISVCQSVCLSLCICYHTNFTCEKILEFLCFFFKTSNKLKPLKFGFHNSIFHVFLFLSFQPFILYSHYSNCTTNFTKTFYFNKQAIFYLHLNISLINSFTISLHHRC
jgi:hypothetical protein